MALSNKEIPTDLREYIEINILPQYATFDKAHRLNHAEKVIEESMKLAQYYEVEPAMVYTIAAYHDLGLCEGREFHHLISGKILAADEKLRKWFSEAQLQTMKEAVEDHRASNKQAPRSMYGKNCGRSRPDYQSRGESAPCHPIWFIQLSRTGRRSTIRACRCPPAKQICLRRIPKIMDTPIFQCPPVGKVACYIDR